MLQQKQFDPDGVVARTNAAHTGAFSSDLSGTRADDLVRITEAGPAHFGTSRSTSHSWLKRNPDTFPQPKAGRKGAHIYDMNDIVGWRQQVHADWDSGIGRKVGMNAPADTIPAEGSWRQETTRKVDPSKLVGTRDLQERYGMRWGTNDWTRKPGFPEPVIAGAGGETKRAYHVADVDAWVADRDWQERMPQGQKYFRHGPPRVVQDEIKREPDR